MKIPEETVLDLIKEEIGEDVLPLASMIFKKDNISEFKIAEKLGITVNQVRSMLYRLQEKNLVTFTRKKDKKKGWYIYSWTLDMREVRFLLLRVHKGNLEHLQKMLELESNGSFFNCGNKCMRMTFENALEFQFKCPECGEVLNQESSGKTVEKIKKDIDKLKHEIEIYSMPDVDLEEEEEKKPKKSVKKQQKKTRMAAKKKMKKVRKALKKRTPKKKPAPKKSPNKSAPKKRGLLRKIFRR